MPLFQRGFRVIESSGNRVPFFLKGFSVEGFGGLAGNRVPLCLKELLGNLAKIGCCVQDVPCITVARKGTMSSASSWRPTKGSSFRFQGVGV